MFDISRSTLTAIDFNTGHQVWQIPLGEIRLLRERDIPITGTENYGSPVVTAGGLLFIKFCFKPFSIS